MFDFFKGLLGKRVEPAQEVPSVEYQEEELSTPEPPPAAPRPSTFRPNSPHQNGKGIELPLQAILSNLPLELQTRIKQGDVGELSIAVPLEKILAQLSRGSVKISFGELRQAVPQVFTVANDRDRVLVPLPLGEILARLNPALIARRRVQKRLEVPADLNGPFDAQGNGLIFSTAAAPPAPSPVPVAPPPRHISPPATSAPAPAVPRGNLIATPAPALPSAEPLPVPANIPFTRPAFRPNGNVSTPVPAAHPAPKSP